MSARPIAALFLLVAACSQPERDLEVDASTTDSAHAVDGALDAAACATDGKLYIAEGTPTAIRVSRLDAVLTGSLEIASVTCPADVTSLGVLLDGSMFAGMKGGGIARVTATACTAMTVTPSLAGDIAIVGEGHTLLALERTGGKLWRIDPASGAATSLSTMQGVTASTTLAGGRDGASMYIPAPLVGDGSLISIDAQGQQGSPQAIHGASGIQAQSDWVSMVGVAGKLWMTTSGYYGAGGGRRTMWLPVETNTADYAAYEYYSSTIAVTAATCP